MEEERNNKVEPGEEACERPLTDNESEQVVGGDWTVEKDGVTHVYHDRALDHPGKKQCWKCGNWYSLKKNRCPHCMFSEEEQRDIAEGN